MQLRRIWDGATLLVQLNAGQGWIDVREILTRLSPRFPEDIVANWSSNLVALLGAPPGLRAAIHACSTVRSASCAKPGSGRMQLSFP